MPKREYKKHKVKKIKLSKKIKLTNFKKSIKILR